MAVAEELGVDHEVILYIKTPPGREDLEKMVKALEDPVEDLVRKDSKFNKLELVPEDYVDNAEAVVEILLKHKQLLQRPVLLRGNKAIIGRPKQRIIDFLSEVPNTTASILLCHPEVVIKVPPRNVCERSVRSRRCLEWWA